MLIPWLIKNGWRVLLMLLFCHQTEAQSPEAAGKDTMMLQLIFQHKVGNKLLKYDSVYRNAFSETFKIDQFKYHIGGIRMETADSSFSVGEDYYLISESTPESKMININLPRRGYRRMVFFIGVDSLKNVSGAQTGALDPLNGMFWTWNTGYVSAKLEGSSLESGLPRKRIEYHIGGFRSPYNAVRKIELSLREDFFTKGIDKPWSIPIKVDLSKWFEGIHALRIREFPACTAPGSLAMSYADNYAGMFEIGFIEE